MIGALRTGIQQLQHRLTRLKMGLFCAEERQAIDEYAWPITLRVAGYATALGALAELLFGNPWPGLPTAAASFGLWLVFLVGFHVICQNHYRPKLGIRYVLFALQTVAAMLLLYVNYNFGCDLLVYVLAAEVQFLLPFRASIAATVVLWLLLGVNESIVWPSYYGNGVAKNWLASPAGFIFVAAFTRSAVTELVQRRRSTLLLTELNEAHTQLQQRAHRAEELAVVHERNRMAREIHDTLGHYLTVINVQLEAAQKLNGRDPALSQTSLSTAKRLATECLNEVRRSVAALRPAALEEVAFPEAIARLIEELRRGSSLVIHLEVRGEGRLLPAAEVAAYRFVQEALTNVRKHAGAGHVWLTTDWEGRAFRLSIRDDGRGAEPSALSGEHGQSLGLRGMRERLEVLGGRMEIATAPGIGFTIVAQLPYEPPQPDMVTQKPSSLDQVIEPATPFAESPV